MDFEKMGYKKGNWDDMLMKMKGEGEETNIKEPPEGELVKIAIKSEREATKKEVLDELEKWAKNQSIEDNFIAINIQELLDKIDSMRQKK